MTFDTLILAVAAALFVVALVALTGWAFKSFAAGGRNGMIRPREKRLGVVETGIKGRPHLEPPLGDVIIAHNETRPAPDFAKK